jgi:surfeit locus 1 family protein
MIFGIRRFPVGPTIIVLAAVATMIGLGVWQLQRAEWKDSLIQRYSTATDAPGKVDWPDRPSSVEEALYRRSELRCDRVTGWRSIAGRSAEGMQGWAHVALCKLDGGGEAEVALGWSRDPREPEWSGGDVGGFVAPAGEGARLVADPPRAGLEQLARPDPGDLPNNHLAYAVQWFFFALTALVVFVLALRRQQRGDSRA